MTLLNTKYENLLTTVQRRTLLGTSFGSPVSPTIYVRRVVSRASTAYRAVCFPTQSIAYCNDPRVILRISDTAASAEE